MNQQGSYNFHEDLFFISTFLTHTPFTLNALELTNIVIISRIWWSYAAMTMNALFWDVAQYGSCTN
jgi:hypothetical protein